MRLHCGMSMSFFFTKVIELLLRDFQNDGGADVCGGPSPACYITLEQYASDNRVGAVNGTCGTCDTDAFVPSPLSLKSC